MPRAVKPEMRVQRQAVVEADQQVLPARLDVVHPAAQQPAELGFRSTPRAGHGLVDQGTAQHIRDPGEIVAFRHGY